MNAKLRCGAVALMIIVQSAWASLADVSKVKSFLVDASALTVTGDYGAAINGQAFQEEMIWSHNGWQYIGYYNAARHVCLTRRKLPAGDFERIEFADYDFKSNDAHNTISLGICANDGTVHLAWDHHAESLHYRVSQPGVANHPEKIKWSAELFAPVRGWLMTNQPVDKVTYPTFFATPDGELQMSFRIGRSGAGDWMLADYRAAGHAWENLRQIDSGRGDFVFNGTTNSHRSSYPNRYQYGSDGKLQLTWVWRESALGANHDLNYAASADGGFTWQNNSGQLVATSASPAKASSTMSIATTGLVVELISPANALMNTQAQAIDSQGRVHVVMWHCNGETLTGASSAGVVTDKNWGAPEARRYHHYWRESDGVWRHFEIPGEVGTRPQLLMDKNDDALLIFTRRESGAHWGKGIYFEKGHLIILKATAKSGWHDWREVAQVAGSFLGEAQVDAYRFKKDGVLSVAMQDSPVKPGAASALKVWDFSF